MILIKCPNCGPRDETEYHYGGQAHVPYPEDPHALSDEEWARYLFYRQNPKGLFAERWVHSAGCRKWFNVLRDTVSYRIEAVYRLGEPRPTCLEKPREHHSLVDSAQGGRIDRSTELLSFTVDGQPYVGHPGDTLASALLAAGVIETATFHLSRPAARHRRRRRRGAERAGQRPTPRTERRRADGSGDDPGAGRRPRGHLPVRGRRARSGRRHRRSTTRSTSTPTCSSSAAARPASPRPREAAATGARVILIDDQPELGGSLLSEPNAEVDGLPAATGCPGSSRELRQEPEVTILTRTNAFGSYDANYVIALENRTDHLGAGPQRT